MLLFFTSLYLTPPIPLLIASNMATLALSEASLIPALRPTIGIRLASGDRAGRTFPICRRSAKALCFFPLDLVVLLPLSTIQFCFFAQCPNPLYLFAENRVRYLNLEKKDFFFFAFVCDVSAVCWIVHSSIGLTILFWFFLNRVWKKAFCSFNSGVFGFCFDVCNRFVFFREQCPKCFVFKCMYKKGGLLCAFTKQTYFKSFLTL